MRKGSFVWVDVVLNENATLFQLEKGKRKAVRHALAQCLGEESPLLPSQDPDRFLRKNSGRLCRVPALVMRTAEGRVLRIISSESQGFGGDEFLGWREAGQTEKASRIPLQ